MFLPRSMSHVLLALLLVGFGSARAAAAVPSPAPSASPSPAASEAPSDPCGGDTRLLATLDRPTIGFSTCAVAAHTTVLEIGYQNATQTGASAGNLAQYPQLFARIGVRPRLEVDILAPNDNRSAAGGALAHGYNDAGVGFKYEFEPKTKFLYAVDGIVTLATGSSGFTAGAPGYIGNLNVAYALSPAIGLGTTLSAQSLSGYDALGSRSRYFTFVPSIVVTGQIPNAVQFYAELVSNSKVAPDLGNRLTLDYGVQKLLNKRFEVDVEMGRGLNEVAGQRFHYLGVGFGIQL